MKLIEKYKELSRPVKAAIWFSVCNIILKAISFIASPIFTRLLSTNEYGMLSIFTSYEQIILVIATWEVSIGPYQKGLFKYKNDKQNFTASTQLFANLVTLLTFTFVFVFFNAFSSFTELSILSTFFLLGYLLVQPAYSCWFYRQRVEYNYRNSVIVSIAISIASVVFPIIAVLCIDATAEVKFIFTLLPQIAIYLVFYIWQLARSNVAKERKQTLSYWKFFLKFTPPLVIHAISFYLLNQADRVMISKMISKECSAIYSVAYTVASLAIIVQSAIQQVLLPWVYEHLERKDYKGIKNTASILFAITGALYILFILVSPEIVRIAYPDVYYEGIWCIPPIAIGSFFMFLYSMFVNVESYYEETKYIAFVSIFCATLNILLNYYGIQLFGYIACAYTTLICYLLYAIGHYLFMKLALKKHAENNRVYDGTSLLFISIVVLALTGCVLLLYNYIIIRYCIVGVSIICFIIFRKQILSLFKRLKEKA